MKKVLAILLAVALSVALFACGKSDTTTSAPSSAAPDSAAPSSAAPSSAAPAPSSAAPSSAASDSTPGAAAGFEGYTDEAGRDTTGEVGYFNPDFDYGQNPRYKFIYLRIRNSPLYDDMANSLIAWASKANCDMEVADTNNDMDLFLSMLETLSGQGYDGFVLDPDSTTYPAVIDRCRELGIHFMPGMGLPKGEDGLLKNPFVGFDYYQVGVKMGEWLIAQQKLLWPDAQPDEIGVLGVDYSVVPEISVRIDGALSVISEEYPGIIGPDFVDRLNNSGRYYHADTIVGNLDATTAYQVSGAVLATNPQIKYWLIVGCVDDFADGAVTAAMDAGLAGNTVAISMGGPGLFAQWDSGEVTDFKGTLTSIGVIYAEPIFFGLYALVTGDATEETLWVPEWVNKSRGETYAQLLLPTIILEHDTYEYYFDWVNNYIGLPLTNYSARSTPDMFSTRVNPPPAYAG